MNALTNIVDRVRSLDLERNLGLRPPNPDVALEIDGRQLAIVRMKAKRGGKPILEGHNVQELDEGVVPVNLFQGLGSVEQFQAMLARSFDSLGLRPGRVAVVLPDNLAKISLLHLPERPPSRRQLEEVIRFKLHRAVPFRFSEASLAYQILPGEGSGMPVLVSLMRQSLVDQFERALESLGSQPGLIGLCTPNLLNACQERLNGAESFGGDVALLNCARHYFTLLILREGRLVFFRCKSYSMGGESGGEANGILAREVSGSLSYYRDKLDGQGIGALLVRSVGAPFEEIHGRLSALDIAHVEPIDALSGLELPEGTVLEPSVAQRIAPALGAALGGR